VNIRFD